MKITKAKLKEIIKEEVDRYRRNQVDNGNISEIIGPASDVFRQLHDAIMNAIEMKEEELGISSDKFYMGERAENLKAVLQRIMDKL